MRAFFSFSLSWLFLVAGGLAYTITGGEVSFNGNNVFQISKSSSDVHRVTLDSARDTVSISVSIKGTSQPHQLLFLLSDTKGLDHPIFAAYSNGRATAEIMTSSLPSALKLQDRIFVNLIAASEGEKNINTPLLELVPSDSLKSSITYTASPRLGAQPEIHHIFKEDPTTINAFFPIVFSVIALFLFVALLGAWMQLLGKELFGSMDASTWKAGFLSSLAFLEFSFVNYYLGASIFNTLFKFFIIAGPFLFFGSRTLSALARKRTDENA